MLRYNRNRARGRFFPLFSPRELFYGSVPGAWYDPTDLSTMFQDSTGLTPVTAVEQPVGLIFDKSQGTPTARYNLLTYTEQFDNAAWTKIGAGTGSAPVVTPNAATAPDGTLTADSIVFDRGAGNTASDVSRISQSPTVVSGTYTMSVWLKAATAGDVGKQLALRTVGGGAYGVVTLTADWVRHTRTETGAIANWQIDNRGTITTGNSVTALVWGAQLQTGSTATTYQRITSGIGGEWTPGNHAYQSTAASRPTYRARYNLLTYSEQFDNAAWLKFGSGTGVAPVVTANAATAPDGTLTADSIVFNRGAGNLITDQSTMYQAPTVVGGSHTQTIWLKAATPADVGKQLGLRNVAGGPYLAVTLTADWVRYSRVETGTAGNFEISSRGTFTTSNTVTALVWGAQLLTAADVTATGNAYQRIAAATVYDTAPIFRPYLAFDGLDDSLSTAAINFTATDKMTVFAGVTKLSDAAVGILAELSADANSNAGSWFMAAPVSTFANGDYGWKTRGTVNASGIWGVPVLSPNTSVLTGIGEIATDTAILRRNGAQYATGANDQGAGNYGNYAMFIGRRGGTTLPFNGRIYELIVRGAASSTTEIIDAEQWVNQRTGAF